MPCRREGERNSLRRASSLAVAASFRKNLRKRPGSDQRPAGTGLALFPALPAAFWKLLPVPSRAAQFFLTRRSIVRITKSLIALSVFVFVLGTAVSVSAQTPPPQATPQAQQAPPAGDQAQAQLKSPVEGELLSVDTEKKVVEIKLANGKEEKFTYTDTTEISGAEKNAAGLATMKEGRVTVHFTENAQTKAKTATRIIVQPKQ